MTYRSASVSRATDSAANTSPKLTICICTRRRTEALEQTLASLVGSEQQIGQVIVSDDGPDLECALICQNAVVPVQYTLGPRQGLGANRNHVLTLVTSRYLMFIDDDCWLGDGSVQKCLETMVQAEAEHGVGRVIVTGAEHKNGSLVEPSEQSFLGFQNMPYEPDSKLRTVVINATVFPTHAARRLWFDSRLRYGYEESDFTTRAVAAGMTIVYAPGAVNLHFPSELGREGYDADATVSRLYATAKRYVFTERRVMRAVMFLGIAPLHAVGSAVKADGLSSGVKTAHLVGRSFRLLLEYAFLKLRSAGQSPS